TVTAGPQVTSVTPSSMNRSQSGTVTINGTGFQPGVAGTTVAFTPNTGITAGAATVVDATHITVPVTIAADAPETQRDVTVTNPDGGVGTCTKCFSIGPKPTVAGAFPTSTGQGTQRDVLIKGTN